MRILLSVASLAAEDGGPSNAVLSIARELSFRSTDVTVVAPRFGDEMAPDSMHSATDAGVRVLQPSMRRKTRWRFSWRLAVHLLHEVKQADAVSIHGFYQFPALFSFYLCLLFRKRYVVQPHGALEPYQQRQSQFVKATYMLIGGRACIRGAKSINVASEAEFHNIAAQFPEAAARVIGMGVDWQTNPQPCGGMATTRSHLLSEPVRLLFLSRIAPKKRIDVLIDALAGIDDFSWTLQIAGSGSAESEAAMLRHIDDSGLSNQITWAGHVGREQKQKLFCDADIFVLPSENENFGQAVTEAMAHGTPVITTRQVGAAVQLEESQGGLVIAEPNSTLLREAIRRLAKDRALRVEMGERAFRYAQANLTWASVARDVEASLGRSAP